MAGDVEEVTVRLTGGAPWGFRLKGGAGSPVPLFVAKVRKKSKSYPALEEGDQLVSVNGASCSHMSYDQAMNLVDRGGLALELDLLRKKKVPKFSASTSGYSPQTWEQAVSSEIVSKNATEREAYHLKSFQQRTTQEQEDEMRSVASAGQMEASAGQMEASAGQMEVSAGQMEASTGQMEASAGQMEVSAGQMEVSAGQMEVSAGQMEASAGQMEASAVQKTVRNEQQSIDQEDTSTKTPAVPKQVVQEEATGHTSAPIAQPYCPGLPKDEPMPSLLRRFTPGLTNTSPRPFTPTFTDTVAIAEAIKAQNNEKFFQSMGPRPFTPTFSEFGERHERSPSPQSAAPRNLTRSSEFSLKDRQVLYTKGPRPFTPTFAPGRSYYNEKSVVQQTTSKGPRPFTPTLSDAAMGDERCPMMSVEDHLTFPTASELRDDNKENASPFSTTKSQIDEMIREIEADFFDKREKTQQKEEHLKKNDQEAPDTREHDMVTDPKIYQPPPEMDNEDLPFPIRKKKMFSSSSFYEEPNSIFPTVEEQVELCRKIADSLSSVTNQRSKGANMFFKRVKRSQRWVHEASNNSSRYSETSTTEESEPEDLPYVKVSKGPPKLKLILDPRHIQDLSTLRQQGVAFVEHNTQSPDVCRDIVRDLNSPQGRGAKMFAKRKLKSEEWVVDESRVREYLRKAKSATPQPTTMPAMGLSHTLPRTQKIKIVKTPWEAALESPFGSCDSAFVSMHPNEVAETVIRAAESKLTSSCFSGTTTEMSTPLGSTPEPTLTRSGPTFNNTARAWGVQNPRQAFRPVVFPCT